MRTLIKCSLLVGLLSITSSCSRESHAPPIPLSFNKSSAELNATVVVATLDAPLPNGKNAIWCASFQAAWKALEELAGEPIVFEELPDVAKYLNDAMDPRPNVPQGSLYAVAGWNQNGIINQIQNDLKQRFPGKTPPAFSGILPDSLVAYAYLEANVRFTRPYDQNRRPLVFTESSGKKVEVESFGLSAENHNGEDKLWDQPHVLFRKGEAREDNLEFAIDLCSNSYPSQIVVARIAREPTLAAAVGRVERETAEMPHVIEEEAARSGWYSAERLHRIESTDALLVPDFHWALSNHFTELERKVLLNQRLKGQRMDIAQQDILFRLEKSGAALKSESKSYAAGIPTDFFLDRPFLVYLKKRGSEMPYFAMWVDNAELMRLWQTTR
jgi:hypothetical protein